MKSVKAQTVKAQTDLEHRVWKLIREYDLQKKRILVALSGGRDSTALLCVLHQVHEDISAVYFHHGTHENASYRQQAQEFCQKLCADLEVPFFLKEAQQMGSSEEEHRQERYKALQELMAQENFEVLALGHHRQDLLETRLLRLIRGTGGQGLTAMEVFKDFKFRPLLNASVPELQAYLSQKNRTYVEDPSNATVEPLRNWLRQDWLPQLEARQPGASAALARSLETLAQESMRTNKDLLQESEVYKAQALSRSYYLQLGWSQQRRLLAQYLFSLGKRDFTQAHLEEIQKRLDNSQKVITFKVGGLNWEINAEQIRVQS